MAHDVVEQGGAQDDAVIGLVDVGVEDDAVGQGGEVLAREGETICKLGPGLRGGAPVAVGDLR